MITKSPNYSWKAHHLADIDFTWDGRWFPDREIARGEGDHRHEIERALGVLSALTYSPVSIAKYIKTDLTQ